MNYLYFTHFHLCCSLSLSIEQIKEIVKGPELCGKLTFPVSLKQPGPRDGTIQCFIKRDKSNLTYHLFLCLSPTLLVENGKFLLSAKRTRRTTCTEYVISTDADNISRSTSTYIGKLRSNFLGTKFIIYDTQPPHSCTQISYELNVLGTRGPNFKDAFAMTTLFHHWMSMEQFPDNQSCFQDP
ncbi:hypothetical protein Leryth_013156 [Lithospermum erythrorhizon]|nr:hypothetical protein Leryth_013156 [Lithospermum erythrorhizon]